jgi:hypothetical protein
MRGAREKQTSMTAPSATATAPVEISEMVDLLTGIRDELRQTRELLERSKPGHRRDGDV